MIKFKAKDLVQVGPVLSLMGNDKEEQIVMVMTYTSSLLIVVIPCDDALKIVYNSASAPVRKAGKASMSPEVLLETVRGVVAKWARTGLPPTPEQDAKLTKQLDKLMIRVKLAWGL